MPTQVLKSIFFLRGGVLSALEYDNSHAASLIIVF